MHNKLSAHRHWSHVELIYWRWALFTGTIFLFAARTIMPICSVNMAKELHWDRRDTGVALGAFFWGYMSVQYLGGHLADKLGGERMLVYAGTGWSTVMVLTPFLVAIANWIPDYQLSLIVISRVLLGICQGFHFPSMGSLMGRRVSISQRTFTWTFICCGMYFGILLSGTLGSLLNELISWQAAFIAVGLPGLIWVLIVAFCLLNKQQSKNITITLSVTDDDTVYYKKLHHDTPDSDKDKQPLPWRKLLFVPAFWAMLAGHFASNNSFYILLSWMPTYFHDQFPAARAWIFNVVPWILSIPASLFSGIISDHLLSRKTVSVTFVRKLMTTITLIGAALMVCAISFVHDYSLALTCLACAYVYLSCHHAGIGLNPQDIAPNHGGAVYGLMNLAGAIPGFLGVYTTGYILQTTQSWPAVFYMTSTVCVIGWLLYQCFGTARAII